MQEIFALKKILLNTLKIVLPIGVGLYLTWFFISNMSAEELHSLKEAFLKAEYIYLFFGFVIMLLSHMSRAYRWKYMLEPLGHKPRFWKMYHSIMIGYVINLTIPRSGEVARAGYYARHQKGAAFEKVFGTIIVERIIDVVMLGMVFGFAAFLQKELCNNFTARFSEMHIREKTDFLLQKLNRPIRVCGMVKNEGEPGGGPFWIKNSPRGNPPSA